MVYCAGKIIENVSYFIKAIDHTFYGFTGVITSFSRVLPTYRVGYHAGKPIGSLVFCLNNSYTAVLSFKKIAIKRLASKWCYR